MAISRVPSKVWLQIAIICLGFFGAVIAAGYFWSVGAHTMALAPLGGYSACVTFYSVYVRHYRQS